MYHIDKYHLLNRADFLSMKLRSKLIKTQLPEKKHAETVVAVDKMLNQSLIDQNIFKCFTVLFLFPAQIAMSD